MVLIGVLMYKISYNQSNYDIKKQNDSAHFYSDTVTYYTFNFIDKKQYFFWDTISKTENLYNTMFLIKNNTDKDINVIYTNSKAQRIQYSGKRHRTIKPGGYYEVDINFYLSEYPRRISEQLRIYYETEGDTILFSMRTKGFYKPKPSKKYIPPLKDKKPSITRYHYAKKGNYVYDITNKRNFYNWGEIKSDQSTDLVTFTINNPTNDTIFIRSIDMPYDKIFVEAEINGEILKNRTNFNIPLYPKQELTIATKILSIDEPIYHFHFPNSIDIVYFHNNVRTKYRLINESTKREPIKLVDNTKLLESSTLSVAENKSKADRVKKQRYKLNKNHYYFNFTDTKQVFDWGKVYVSPKLDSAIFLIKNNTNHEITVTKTTLRNNFTNWSLSRQYTVKPNAYYEVKPQFYSSQYTESKLNYPLRINYKSNNKAHQLTIETKIDGIFKPKTERKEEILKAYKRGRGAKVNNITKNRSTATINYTFDFANTNYGFYWGDFDPLVNQEANFCITNNSDKTIYISQINNPLKNFVTKAIVNGKLIENTEYTYTAVLPNQEMMLSMFAKSTRSYRFQFPFNVRIKYFIDGERKVMSLISSGNFIKPKPLVDQRPINKLVVKKVKPVVTKQFYLTLGVPNIPIDDLVLIRWRGAETDTFKLEENYSKNFNVKDKELLHGMFYCPKYGVISKFYHKVDFRSKSNSNNLTIPVHKLFTSRDDYYYAGYTMSNIKQPYKRKEKTVYRLDWKYNEGYQRAYYDEVINYIKYLGYGSDRFIYEPNLNKAIALERKLKNCKYHINMLPVDWHHGVSVEGWGGGNSYYVNHFQIEFIEGVSEEWIKAFFRKYQITDYKFYKNVYTFKFKYVVSRSFMRVLDKMWMKREVKKIKQFKSGSPDMD